MAKIKLLKGLSSALKGTPVIEGQLLFTTDTGVIHLDTAGTAATPGTDADRVELYKIPLKDVNDAVDALEALVGTKSVQAQIAEKVESLDKADAAVAHQFVTGVSEADGIISVVRAALVEADIPALAISKITGLQDALDAKQDNLVFDGTYDAATNKVATKKTVDDAVKGLSGAMHFVGTSTTDPKSAGGATVAGAVGFAAGDVVLFGSKEYVYDGSAWIELGDETSYAVKGSIKDADIANDAAIATSKIAGLDTEIANLKGTASDTKDTVSIAGAKKYAEELVTDLDVTDAAVDGEFVTAVSQADGKITVSRKKVELGALEWGSFGSGS